MNNLKRPLFHFLKLKLILIKITDLIQVVIEVFEPKQQKTYYILYNKEQINQYNLLNQSDVHRFYIFFVINHK